MPIDPGPQHRLLLGLQPIQRPIPHLFCNLSSTRSPTRGFDEKYRLAPSVGRCGVSEFSRGQPSVFVRRSAFTLPFGMVRAAQGERFEIYAVGLPEKLTAVG